MIAGEFNDSTWRFRSRRLRFTGLDQRLGGNSKLSDTSTQMAKAFILNQIMKKFDYSAELILGRLVAFRCLASEVDRQGWKWCSLRASHFDEVVERLKRRYATSSVYHRAGGLTAVAAYLNGIKQGRGSEEVRFVRRRIQWRHALDNPIRLMQDPTSDLREHQRQAKYQHDLPQCVAKAREKLVGNPSLEPVPGYDLIRMEALAFMLALGLRVGEVTSLPVHALDEDSVAGSVFLRVPVEKGGAANAMPVPAVWEDPIRKAYLYLLESCAEARAQARLIENQGFSFICSALTTYRAEIPISDSVRCQMRVAGLDDARHFLVKEIAACFPVSEKQLSAGGRYHAALVPVAKPMASRVVEWLDTRFGAWDWLSYSREKSRNEAYSFVVNDLAAAISVNAGNISKQPFIVELRSLLRSMSEAGCFDPRVKFNQGDLAMWQERWKMLRRSMLSVTGGAHGNVVDIDRLQVLLSAQYSSYISRHFDELVAEEDDIEERSGGEQQSARNLVTLSPRPGVETKLSDHLIVVWDGQFAADRPRGLVPRPLFRADIYSYLRENSRKRTVFQRLGIRNAIGEIASFTPHMIRHWVTTAMLRSGPNELAVDMWMNRSPRQGRSYDHRTAKERAEIIRQMYLRHEPPNDFMGRRVIDWRRRRISEDEIVSMIAQKLRVVHFTPWGSCSRDLYTAPCSKGLMCVRGFGTGTECSSFQVDVDDDEARERVARLLHEHESMLRAIEPNYQALADVLVEELDTAMALDQHLAYILDVIRGCKNVLSAYTEAMRRKGPE